jgi:hypothetical protein
LLTGQAVSSFLSERREISFFLLGFGLFLISGFTSEFFAEVLGGIATCESIERARMHNLYNKFQGTASTEVGLKKNGMGRIEFATSS